VIRDESKTLGEYEVVDNSIILIAETKSTKVDIGVFDSHHLGSRGREWLMQSKSVASEEEVKAMIEGLGHLKQLMFK
jgi:FAD synthase